MRQKKRQVLANLEMGKLVAQAGGSQFKFWNILDLLRR
jgi:hypothetical protein